MKISSLENKIFDIEQKLKRDLESVKYDIFSKLAVEKKLLEDKKVLDLEKDIYKSFK